MVLTVTPGGASDDSYISLADLKAHWDAIGFDYSGYTDPQIEEAARRATVWLDGTYGARFPGSRTSGRAQALEWPRSGAVDRDGNTVDSATIPREIEKATAEAARYEVSGTDLSPTVTTGATVKREKVGPLEVEYAASGSVDAQRPVLTVVDGILAALFSTGRGTKFVMRA